MYKMKIFMILFSLITAVNADMNKLEQMVEKLKEKETIEKSEAVEFANQKGIPLREEFKDGRVIEIQKIKDGIPLYYTTHNEDAAISTSTDHLWSAPFSVTGEGYDHLGEWDGGAVRGTHDELIGRVTQVDGATTFSDHATHVAGTLIASGQDTSAKGMAYKATLLAYDWNSDESEMATAASNGMEVSNHSYGYITGWNGSDSWYGSTSVSSNEAYRFGFYSSQSEDWDNIAYNAPNYLIMKSAGNDRNDNAPSAGTKHSHNGSGTYTDTHNSDGFDDGGYDTISDAGVAKNILTVGAVNDVANYNSPSDVVMSSFSGWGPADDGRIKPDIVGNGVGLRSSLSSSDSSYGRYSGTSMSSPNVAGSLALLQQYYNQTHGGDTMRSATLKALVIHTAEEAGSHMGPDYQYGWGLLNTQKAAQKIEEDSTQNSMDELTLSDGNSYTRDVVIGAGISAFKVTIVWTDPAGTPVSAALDPLDKMLVNDLDLKITKGGTNYYPWKLDRVNPSHAATKTGENDIDNVEQVYIENPTSGTYTITVDHDGVLASDQSFSIIIDEGSGEGSDLIVELPSVSDATLSMGQSFTAYATVKNQGDALSESTTLRYYLSTDSTISTSDTELATDSVATLASGETSAEDASLTAPVTAGTYYIGACVDTVNGESNSANNCSGAVQIIVGDTDLIVESPSISDTTLEEAQPFTASATVKNMGTDTSASSTLRYYISIDSTISTADTQIGTDDVSSLTSGETSNESETVTTSKSAGTYWVGVCVDTISGESNTSNNCSVAIEVTIREKTITSGVAVSGTVEEGEFRYYKISATTNQTVTTLLYDLISDNDLYVKVGSKPTQSVYDCRSWLSGTQEESCSITMTSDNDVYIGVHGYESGSYSLMSTVTNPSSPDLIVESVSVSDATLTTGESFTASAIVKNQGNSSAESTTLRYYLSNNATISTTDTELATDSVAALSPNETSPENASLTAPATAGTYYIGACVDTVNDESDSTNNCSSAVQIVVSEDAKDTDGDGISDVDELANGLDPLDASDAQADFDGDGFSNALEISLGSDIRNASVHPEWVLIPTGDGLIIVIPFMP